MSLTADPREPPKLRPGPAMARVSVGWDGTEDVDATRRWLELRLPENGTRTAYQDRAKVLLLAHRTNALPRSPETVLRDNTDCEYPGAISLSSDGTRPLAAVPLAQYRPVSERGIEALLASAVHAAHHGGFRDHGGASGHRARFPVRHATENRALEVAGRGLVPR